jgi:hypothetical protein
MADMKASMLTPELLQSMPKEKALSVRVRREVDAFFGFWRLNNVWVLEIAV